MGVLDSRGPGGSSVDVGNDLDTENWLVAEVNERDLRDGLLEARATRGSIAGAHKALGTGFKTGLAGGNAWLHGLCREGILS